MANFNEILERAKRQKEVVESKKSSGGNYIYPGEGSTSFRLLYNPATNNIFRQVARHWSDDLKKHVPCLSMYGLPCPICEVKKLYEKQFGKDAGWKLDAQRKVIFHATYKSADKPSNDKVKEGDTVIIMTAPSIENEFNKLFIDDLADGLNLVLTDPKGIQFSLKRYNDNGFTKYSLTPNPIQKVESAKSEEEMVKLLESLPDISEAYFPKNVTDDMKKSVIEVAKKEMEKYGITLENKVIQDMEGGSVTPPIPGQN